MDWQDSLCWRSSLWICRRDGIVSTFTPFAHYPMAATCHFSSPAARRVSEAVFMRAVLSAIRERTCDLDDGARAFCCSCFVLFFSRTPEASE